MLLCSLSQLPSRRTFRQAVEVHGGLAGGPVVADLAHGGGGGLELLHVVVLVVAGLDAAVVAVPGGVDGELQVVQFGLVVPVTGRKNCKTRPGKLF